MRCLPAVSILIAFQHTQNRTTTKACNQTSIWKIFACGSSGGDFLMKNSLQHCVRGFLKSLRSPVSFWRRPSTWFRALSVFWCIPCCCNKLNHEFLSMHRLRTHRFFIALCVYAWTHLWCTTWCFLYSCMLARRALWIASTCCSSRSFKKWRRA